MRSDRRVDGTFLAESAMPNLHDIHFTLAEARALLPTLLPSLERIAQLKERLDRKGFSIYQGQYIGGGTNGTTSHPREWEEFVDTVQGIQQQGVVIKDPERGLIDFPSIRSNGEEVYLCYLLGEQDIEWWHSIPDGFRGRRRVDEL